MLSIHPKPDIFFYTFIFDKRNFYASKFFYKRISVIGILRTCLNSMCAINDVCTPKIEELRPKYNFWNF